MRTRVPTEWTCFTGHSSLERLRRLILILIGYLVHTHSRESKMYTQQLLYGATTTLNGMTLCKEVQEHATSRLQWEHLQNSPTLLKEFFWRRKRMNLVYSLFDFSYVESPMLLQLTIPFFSSMILMMVILGNHIILESERITNTGLWFLKKHGRSSKEPTSMPMAAL